MSAHLRAEAGEPLLGAVGGGSVADGRQAPPLFHLPDAATRATASRRAPGMRRYLTRYLHTLRAIDLAMVVIAIVTVQLARLGEVTLFPTAESSPSQLRTIVLGLGLVVGWMLVLQWHNTYDARLIGHGIQEYRQIVTASIWLLAGFSVAAFAFQVNGAHRYVLYAFPLATLLLLAARWTARKWLVTQRAAGRMSDRVLLVGDRDHVQSLSAALSRIPGAGYRVLGACIDDASGTLSDGIEVLGREADVLVQALAHRADVIAVSSSAGIGTKGLRRLGWALEGTTIELVVAPGIMDVAGPRVLTRPIDGLPLIHVEAPRFSGPRAVVKTVLDRVGAALGLLLLAPVFLAVALLVRLDDPGPVFYRQERVGRNETPFRMIKFRSMALDADERLAELKDQNEGAGPLFKLRDDPRVTRVGKYLRRFSVDEMPQLVNVLLGQMSLVGPRPPLATEVAEYELDTRRRLLVNPGMTGLWQISGRTELAWEEAVRLDLYYVENWTPLLDLMIIWRTFRVVLDARRNGAY